MMQNWWLVLEKYGKASQVASDVVGSIRTVASFTAKDKGMELYKKKCKGLVATSIQNGLVSGIGFGLSFLILYFVYATSFYTGARLVQDGKTTFADVFRTLIETCRRVMVRLVALKRHVSWQSIEPSMARLV